MSLTSETRDAITRAATEAGLDPAMALATAERESDFNVHERSRSSSAYGTFQLLKAERDKYGGNSADPYEQAQAWGRYIQGTKAEMAKVLGRDPTSAELYAGHYWGGSRAARIVGGHVAPETPVAEVFTPRELAANPDLAKAGTVGALKDSVLADMNRRLVKYGGEGEAPDLTSYGTPVNAKGDFGTPIGPKGDKGDFPEPSHDRWQQVPMSPNIEDRRSHDYSHGDMIPPGVAAQPPQSALSGAAHDAGFDDIPAAPPTLQPVQWDKSIAPAPPPLPTSPPPGATPAWGLPQQ